jgi:hypothetical protein
MDHTCKGIVLRESKSNHVNNQIVYVVKEWEEIQDS